MKIHQKIKLEPRSVLLGTKKELARKLINRQPFSWRSNYLSFSIGLIILCLIWTFVIRFAFVSGQSMQPSLKNGQIIVLRPYLAWLKNSFQAGDLVVFKAPKGLPKKRYIKRLIALPGDTLAIRADGLYLNDKKQPQNFASRPDTFPNLIIVQGKVVAFEGFPIADLPEYLKPAASMLLPLSNKLLEKSFSVPLELVGSLKLAPDSYFVLGDNLTFNASEDSRFFGPISRNDLLAKASPLDGLGTDVPRNFY
jgi:signal peptidase I